MATASESYKQFVNVNGVSVHDRLRQRVEGRLRLTTTEATDMLITARTLEESLVITREEADGLVRLVASKRS